MTKKNVFECICLFRRADARTLQSQSVTYVYFFECKRWKYLCGWFLCFFSINCLHFECISVIILVVCTARTPTEYTSVEYPFSWCEKTKQQQTKIYSFILNSQSVSTKINIKNRLWNDKCQEEEEEKMSISSTNSTSAVDVSNSLANETNLNDSTDDRETTLKSKPPIAAVAATAATITTAVTLATTVPAAINPASTATATVSSSNAHFPSISSDQCSDSEEDFDRTTKNLGAHKWIFNYKDVSSLNLPPSKCVHVNVVLMVKTNNSTKPTQA